MPSWVSGEAPAVRPSRLLHFAVGSMNLSGRTHRVRPFLLPRSSNEGLLENRSVNMSGTVRHTRELKYAMSAGRVLLLST